MLDVNSTICIEKEIAADTIGTIFAATRQHFLPYVEQSTIELIALLPHYYDGIRKSAVDSLLEIIRTFYDLSNPEEWQPGSVPVSIPLNMSSDMLIYAPSRVSLSSPRCSHSSATSGHLYWRCTRLRITSTYLPLQTTMLLLISLPPT